MDLVQFYKANLQEKKDLPEFGAGDTHYSIHSD